MTVSFTPNLGLAKPTADEIARLWTDEDQLELANKNALNTYLDPVAEGFQTYFPQIIQMTNIGDTERLGWYVLLPGDLVYGGFIFRLGSGVAFSDNFLDFVLPFDTDTSFHDVSTGAAATGDIVGTLTMRDNSSISNTQTAALELFENRGYTRGYTEDNSATRWVRDDVPFTFEENDAIAGSFWFKASV